MTEAEAAFKTKVFEIADGFRNEERVTNAAVRKRLKAAKTGCSYTRLVPVVAEWKANREYLTRIEGETTLPETVQTALIHLGRLILAEGVAKEKSAAAELTRKEVRTDQLSNQGRDEVLLVADRMEEEIAGLRQEIVRLHEALARAQGGSGDHQTNPDPKPAIPSAPRDLDRITKAVAGLNEDEAKRKDPDALLATVADKVHAMLVELGPRDASQIHFHLDQDFRKQAEAMKMPLEAGWLRHWLRGFTGPSGSLTEARGTFDLASRTADDGAAFQTRVMGDVHALVHDHGFPMALTTITRRLPPSVDQALRLTGGRLGDWMDGRPDLFRKTAKGWYATFVKG